MSWYELEGLVVYSRAGQNVKLKTVAGHFKRQIRSYARPFKSGTELPIVPGLFLSRSLLNKLLLIVLFIRRLP